MNITLLADTHSEHQNVSISDTDLLIVAGDYSRRSREIDFVDFVNWLKIQPAKYKIIINGNHDKFYYRHTARAKEILGNEIILLENSSVIIEGIHIWGSPLTVPVIEGMYNQVERIEEERRKIWNIIPESVDVIITHSPPFMIHDAVKPGVNLGCKALRKKVLEIKPKYHLFGHIHQDYGETEIEGIKFKNGTLVNDNEKIIKKPIVFKYV